MASKSYSNIFSQKKTCITKPTKKKDITYGQIRKLVQQIEKIRNKTCLVKIFNIIQRDKPGFMENGNGIFMLFHDLQNSTYTKIMKLVDEEHERMEDYENNKPKTNYMELFSKKSNTDSFDKFSNKEKNLIRRKQYDDELNTY
jgi:hypothetical protein